MPLFRLGFRRQLVLGGTGLEILKLQFHLVEKPGLAFRTAAVKLPPQLLDLKLQMGDQGIGAAVDGDRPGGFSFCSEALSDRSPRPDRVWNRIPDAIREAIIDLALEAPELSPRELAVRFTDTRGYFVSEASVYRLLKAHDLITSPAFIVVKAADSFKDQTTAPNGACNTKTPLLKLNNQMSQILR